MRKPLLVAVLFLLYFAASAQVAVTGSVLSNADNKPVAGVSIFLSNTTFGTETSVDGTFTLSNVKPGKYELVITVIGFKTYRQTILVGNTRVTLPAIHILQKTTQLNEVVIKVDPNRKKYFDWFYEAFKEEFLGTSDLARDCKILNPEVLDFDDDKPSNTIIATSEVPLKIENDALGYNIQYLLTKFTLKDAGLPTKEIHYEGSVLFTEMTGTPQQERRWQRKRQEVYAGSPLQFMRSALSGQIRENGFRVLRLAIYRNPDKPADSVIAAKIKLYQQLKTNSGKNYRDSLSYWEKKAALPDGPRKLMDYPLTKEDLVHPTDQNGIFALRCDSGQLYITYNKHRNFSAHGSLGDLGKPENTENTLVQFNSPSIFFDNNGTIVNPNSVAYTGVWGRIRIAWLLPADYETMQPEITYGDSTLNTIAKNFDRYASIHNDEKVYLHLDKPNYGYGDTIWYKAYTVVGQKHQLSALSGVLYVELLSPKDSLVTRQVLPMVSGIGWSDIPLAHSLKQGIYRIRAYTRWMQNFEPDYFYDQKVRIGGISPPIAKQTIKENPDIQFFPEGGDLVTGVRSRVAVKVVGATGLGQEIKGTIEDNTGIVVADFSTRHLGMGVFALVPEAGKTYKAKINTTGEATYSIDLPQAKQTGYTLAINNTAKDSIYIKIATNEQTLSIDKDKTFYIIAQSSGKVYYTTQGKLEGTAYMARVEKDRFPEGIVQFTLFNQSGEPLAERIVFVDNGQNELNLDINTSAQTYTTRDKVKLTLTAKSDSSKAVIGSFSVSVINESKVLPDENTESTIENNLLLTSELKGYIEQPNYYFANKSDQTQADLDILMLTQGYRRFEWKQILNNKLQIVPYKPQSTQELSGILTTPAGKPVANGKVTLAATKQNVFRDTIADADGKFTFTNLAFTDTAAVVIKARKSNNGSNVIIKALLPDYPKITPTNNVNETVLIDTALHPLPKQQFTDYQKQQTDDSLKDGKMLNTINITGIRRPKPDMSRSSNLHGGGNADRVVMGADLGHCINLADCLGDKLIGIPGYKSMSVIVDGVNLGKGHLNDVNPNDVYSVEVLYRLFAKAIYGSSIERAGALIITLKNGSELTSNAKPMETAGHLQYSQYEKEQKEDSLKNGKTLNTVNITGIKRPKQPDLTNSANLNGPGHANQVIMNDQMGYGPNLTDRLIGKVFGVLFSNGHAHSTRSPKANMTIIIDGIMLDSQTASLDDINPDDVYSIEVLRSGAYLAIYGSNAPGGALVITMKRGGEDISKVKPIETAGHLQYSQYEKEQKDDSLKNGKTLKTVNIKGIKHSKQPDLTFSSNLNGPGHADQVVMYDQLGTCVDLTDCLTGHVFGVTFDPLNGTAKSTRSLNHFGMVQVPYMRIIVDGVMLGPGASLNDLNPNDIYSIEVLRSGAYLAIYGSNAPLGALVITMKRGREGTAYFTQAQPNGIMTFPFPGFYRAKAFYTPKYEHKADKQIPDNRTTVYWNPNILTDKDGKASIEFYNNDTKGTYRVVVEGIDDEGNLGRKVYRYEVK